MIKPDDICRLDLGYYTMPAGSRWPGQKITVCAYLVRSPSGLVLFDTGIAKGHAKAEREFGPIHRRPLISALAELGLRPGDIAAVANCHLHIDHCGGNPLFRHAPIFVQQAELDALPLLDYTLPALTDFDGAQLHIADGETDVAAGVRIIATPGHTPGHQSVLVETSGGRILLAGQAFDFASDYARTQFGCDIGHDESHEPAWLHQLRTLDVRLALFAHDQLAWDRDTAAGHWPVITG
jgi:N-acyl homoserine lactone hydrolase